MGNLVHACCLTRDKEPVDKDLNSIRIPKHNSNFY